MSCRQSTESSSLSNWTSGLHSTMICLTVYNTSDYYMGSVTSVQSTSRVFSQSMHQQLVSVYYEPTCTGQIVRSTSGSNCMGHGQCGLYSLQGSIVGPLLFTAYIWYGTIWTPVPACGPPTDAHDWPVSFIHHVQRIRRMTWIGRDRLLVECRILSANTTHTL